MKPNEREALRLLGVYTQQTFDMWRLAGPDNAKYRASLMTVLAGRRIPQKNSGMNALISAFYEIAKPEGECKAAQERSFINWAKQQA